MRAWRATDSPQPELCELSAICATQIEEASAARKTFPPAQINTMSPADGICCVIPKIPEEMPQTN